MILFPFLFRKDNWNSSGLGVDLPVYMIKLRGELWRQCELIVLFIWIFSLYVLSFCKYFYFWPHLSQVSNLVIVIKHMNMTSLLHLLESTLRSSWRYENNVIIWHSYTAAEVVNGSIRLVVSHVNFKLGSHRSSQILGSTKCADEMKVRFPYARDMR